MRKSVFDGQLIEGREDQRERKREKKIRKGNISSLLTNKIERRKNFKKKKKLIKHTHATDTPSTIHSQTSLITNILTMDSDDW